MYTSESFCSFLSGFSLALDSGAVVCLDADLGVYPACSLLSFLEKQSNAHFGEVFKTFGTFLTII